MKIGLSILAAFLILTMLICAHAFSAQEDTGDAKRNEDLKQCVQKAEEAYAADWERACRQIGSPPKCPLPTPVMDRFEAPRREAKQECERLYSAK